MRIGSAPSVATSIGRHIRRYGLGCIDGRSLLAMRSTLHSELRGGQDRRLATHLVQAITDELTRRLERQVEELQCQITART